MQLARTIAGEWKLWRAAVRGLSENPVAHYLRLIAQRRRQATPPWRRHLPVIGLVLVITVLVSYYCIRTWQPTGSLDETIRLAWILILLIVSLVLLVIALRLISTTSTDTIMMLADQDNKAQRALLDEMLAASSIDDRDVVVGILSAVVPRFARVSIGGGILFWLWVAAAYALDDFQFSRDELSVILLAPVTIGSITISGLLGAVILSLWLFCHGRGLVGSAKASSAGMATAVGHLIYWPLLVLIIGANLSTYSLAADNYGHHILMPVLVRILVAVVFVAGFELLLSGTIRQRRASAAVTLVAPLLLPLGLLLLILLSISDQLSGYPARLLALAFTQAWGSVLVFNPLAIATRYCLGRDLFSQPLWLEISYALLIMQQLVMAVIGAHKARQAVARWRQQPL